MRREIPLAITFLIGIFMLVDFFVPHHAVSGAAEEMKQWGTIVIAASILLGVGNLIRVHFRKIRRRSDGWQYSITTLLIMAGDVRLRRTLGDDSRRARPSTGCS